jgi:CelD/BcsL family acetyltransferase involved in cellulose biosynthesis
LKVIELPVQWENHPASALKLNSDLTGEWDRLNAKCGDLPFLRAQAVALALDVFGNGSERLLVGRINANIEALFIVVPTGARRWVTFQPSQLPLGAWVSEPTLSLTDLIRSAMRGPVGFCLIFSVTRIDPYLVQRREAAADSHYSDYIDTGWIDIVGSFEQYWNARGKNLRQNMRKQRTKLASGNITLTMRSLHTPEEMAPAVERYGTLESAGWKANEGTAIQGKNSQGVFYRTLLENAALRNEAVVYELLFGDRVVAINLCLKNKNTLVVLKTTYDESIKSCSPAFLLRQMELEKFFQEKCIARLEYYGRIMDWHTKLTETKRTLYHLTVYRFPLLKYIATWRRKMWNSHSDDAQLSPEI